MIYRCNENCMYGPKPWVGKITLLSKSPFHYEAEVNTRGTYFHVIVFRGRGGNCLCVPNHNIGCELSDFDDTMWNSESIGAQLANTIDVESLTCAVKFLPIFDEVI